MRDRGLDLGDLDGLSEEEAAGFRHYYSASFGGSLAAYELWFGLRPDVLKLHRRQAVAGAPADVAWTTLLYLHHYAVTGFREGVAYQIENARTCGFTRDQVVAVLAVAFQHSGPGGMAAVAASAGGLDDYVEVAPPRPLFPANWAPDPSALECGLDPSTEELSADELAAIREWCRTRLGEVPSHVTFLAEHAPALLKSVRLRFERTVRDHLPVQLLPLLQLHLHVSRGSEDGIREALLLARALGVTRADAVWAICGGLMHGGTAALSLVQRSAADLIASLPAGGAA